MALNQKQERFVIEYLKSFNATQAAIEAGYSANTAYSQGSRLLKDVEISAAIEAFMRENAMSAAEVLYHLTAIARGDISDVLDNGGNLDMFAARENHATMLIRKVKQKSITTADKDGEGSDVFENEVEMYDRLKALELLAKYHDLINKSTVRVADWRDEVIQLLREGKVTPDEVAEELGVSLAEELFKSAGIRTVSGR